MFVRILRNPLNNCLIAGLMIATLSALAQAASTPLSHKADTATYSVEIKASEAYAVGKEGRVEISLTSKGDYHLNEQYPLKFKAGTPPAEITYPKLVLARGDGTFGKQSGLLKLPFVAKKAGTYKVGGVFSFSVCSDSNCVMEKLPLEVSVQVK